MEAKEVPEKIYACPLLLEDSESITRKISTEKDSLYRIEYVLLDAFIEKAEEFIYYALNTGIMGTVNIEDFMKLFKKYMKGE